MEIKPYLAAALLLCPLLGFAVPPHWQIDPAKSELSFTGTQNGAPVKGAFKTFSGDIQVDPNDLKNSSFSIIVDINSISASYGEVKTTLITPDWFNVKLFPKAEFKSTKIVKTGENSYQAEGLLTIRDKSQPATLIFTAKQPDANNGTVEGSTVIKRTMFGVGQGEWASTDAVKDEVTVNFKVSAVRK